jgi:quinoprotein glucose dehydrogenase
MDARNGEPCPDFGDNGELDVSPAMATVPNAYDVSVIKTYFPPAVVGGSIIIGSVVGPKFKDANAPSGAVHAFDVRTGAFKWYWDPVPRNPGDPEAVNWTPESLAKTGGGNVWSYMSWDPERDLVFLPTSSVSPNYYGVNRPGDNRYANSTVALRGSTGEMVWNFQTIHHDVWDWDTSPEPMVIELDWEGERKTAVVQLTKQGLTFVYDIETGEPLWPVEERPVNTDGGIEGEQLSPTQPYPVKPPPLSPFVTTVDDAWGYTFIDRAACRTIYDKYAHGTAWQPPTEEGLIIQPGMVNNYGGGAFDPERNLLVTNFRRHPLYVALPPADTVDPEDAKSPMAGMPGGPPGIMKNTEHAMQRGPDQVFSYPEVSPIMPMYSPCTKPPWYLLSAINLSTGEVKWEIPLGTLDTWMGVPLPLNFGAVGIGGPMITAGGLIFIGATSDERFRVFDIETGEELWVDRLPTSSMTIPMTYERDGRQYVVIAAGGHHIYYTKKISDWLIAYALPE